MTEYTITESDVLLYCVSRGLRSATRKTYLDTFKSLGLLGTFSDVDVYTALERVTNVNTRRKHILVLKAFGIHTPKAPRAISRRYYLPTQEEYEFYRALFEFPDRLDLMYYAGLRVGEACYPHLIVGNILRVEYQISPIGNVEPAKSTGNVLIPTWLATKFPLEPWQGTSNRLSKAVYNHSKRLGIPLTAHGLRAAYATRLIDAGMPIVGLQQQMRHANVSTTLTHYVQTTEKQIQALVDGL